MHAKLAPTALVEKAISESRSAFVARFADTLFLLVHVNGMDDATAVALAESAGHTDAELPSNPDALTFGTITKDLTKSGEPKKAPEIDPTGLLRRLREGAGFFVAALRRRTDIMRAFPSRVTVGRARNSDIVLREDGVSKFHAWFERDGDVFFLADARSKNATRVNGRALEPIRLHRIGHGDDIAFGSVRVTVCDPEVFWAALGLDRSRAPDRPKQRP